MSKFLRVQFVDDAAEGLPISYPFNHLDYVGNGNYEDDLYELDDEEYKSAIETALDAEPTVVSYRWVDDGSE